MVKKINMKVAESLAKVMAFFDWEQVAKAEAANFEGDDFEYHVAQLKVHALNEMTKMIERCREENTHHIWVESAYNLRYEYWDYAGFKIMYVPYVADYAKDD